MDITSLGITGVAAITVICLLMGQAVKASGLDSKWIPVLCGVAGLALGVLGMGTVSYTHLDVYKRQGSSLCPQRRADRQAEKRL